MCMCDLSCAHAGHGVGECSIVRMHAYPCGMCDWLGMSLYNLCRVYCSMTVVYTL